MSAAAANPLSTPSGFAKGVFGHDHWQMQRDILDSVAANRRTAVKSCHSSGKTFLAADGVMWWITHYPDGVALTTAPGYTQVEKLLWGEIRTSLQQSKIKYPKPNLTELKLSEGNYALGISTNTATRFQGFKAKNLLLVFDEAPGVEPEIWEATQGLRASGNVHTLIIGNPTIAGGEFNDAFTTKRHMWTTFTISAFDTPNLQDCHISWKDEEGRDVKAGTGKLNLLEMPEDELDKNVNEHLVTRRWVREMFGEWGPEHAYFQSRVLGDFPTQNDDTLIPLAWLEKNKGKLPPETTKVDINGRTFEAKKRVRAGIDVAGPGEAETVLTVFEDDHIALLKTWPNADPRGDIVAALQPWKEELDTVNVDSIGIGWYIYLHLADIFGKVVKPVNVGLEARDKKKFFNAKAEYFWGLRMRVQSGDLTGLGSSPVHEKAIGQLTSIRYKQNPKGQIVIESKDDMRKRGIKSPDLAESIMLAQAEAAPAPIKTFAPPILLRSYVNDEGECESEHTIAGYGPKRLRY